MCYVVGYMWKGMIANDRDILTMNVCWRYSFVIVCACAWGPACGPPLGCIGKLCCMEAMIVDYFASTKTRLEVGAGDYRFQVCCASIWVVQSAR